MVTSSFGARIDPFTGKKITFHTGIDIGAPYGTPAYAARSGIVEKTGETIGLVGSTGMSTGPERLPDEVRESRGVGLRVGDDRPVLARAEDRRGDMSQPRTDRARIMPNQNFVKPDNRPFPLLFLQKGGI
jgi:murein DD-endopeptidase MepM/ murein hydrolase activator NlpD